MNEDRVWTELGAIANGAKAARRKAFYEQSGGTVVIALVMEDQFDTWLRPLVERGDRTARDLLNGLYSSDLNLRKGKTRKCLFCDDRCSNDNSPGAFVLIKPDNEEASVKLGRCYFVCRACASPKNGLEDRVLAHFRIRGAGLSHIASGRVITAYGEKRVPLLGLKCEFDVDALCEYRHDPTEVTTLYCAIRAFKGETEAALALWEEWVAAAGADFDDLGRRLATFTVALVKVWFEVIADEEAPLENRREFARILTASAEDSPDERIGRALKAYEACGSCPLQYAVDNLLEVTFPPMHLSNTRAITPEEFEKVRENWEREGKDIEELMRRRESFRFIPGMRPAGGQ